MLLYNVYYNDGRSEDSCVPLPRVRPDMVKAVNLNWGGFTLRPVRRGAELVWADGAGEIYEAEQ